MISPKNCIVPTAPSPFQTVDESVIGGVTNTAMHDGDPEFP